MRSMSSLLLHRDNGWRNLLNVRKNCKSELSSKIDHATNEVPYTECVTTTLSQFVFEYIFGCFMYFRYNIMKKCWEHEQQDRPSFQDIHKQLKEMLAENDVRYF